MDSPTEFWKPRWPRYDAEATFINFKNIPSYATAHLLHQVCSALRRHADSRVSKVFNAQVRNRGWSSMRAYHDLALLDEFLHRGIDTSAVTDGENISFAHPVRYDMTGNRLIAKGWISSPHTKLRPWQAALCQRRGILYSWKNKCNAIWYKRTSTIRK